MDRSIITRFKQVFPDPKLRLIRDRILEGYPAAPKFYSEHLSNVRDRRLLARMRTAGVEDALLEICQDDPALYAVSSSNRRRTWGFALVESTDFLFTAATLRSLRSKPPSAQYREDLGDQLQMFAPQPPASSPIDALLVHVAPRRAEQRPAELQIRFLNGEGRYHSEVIDLLALDVFSRRLSVGEERVVRTARVAVRERRNPASQEGK